MSGMRGKAEFIPNGSGMKNPPRIRAIESRARQFKRVDARFQTMKTLIASFAVLHMAAGVLSAQIIPPVEPPKERPTTPPTTRNNSGGNARGIWQASLPGGEYAVSTDKITSVSRHSYLLDGALVVDEVTVDTIGQALARFYFITPVGAQGSAGGTASAAIERGKGILDSVGQRTGADLENMVIKKYPVTTHAKTIEYRIATQQELTNLFESAKQAWQSGQGGTFSAQMK